MALFQYSYNSQNWTQFFFGSPSVDSTFNHQGNLPILKIDSINTATDPDTLSVSAEYSYDYNSASHITYFAEPSPQINDQFLHSDGTTTLNVDSVDAVNFSITVSVV